MQMYTKSGGVWIPHQNFIEYPHENERQIFAYKKLQANINFSMIEKAAKSGWQAGSDKKESEL